jgi:hypothetical protein
MFWPFLVAGTAISLALTKLGALLVLVAILSASHFSMRKNLSVAVRFWLKFTLNSGGHFCAPM